MCEFLVLASGISFNVIRAFALGFVERSKCLTIPSSLAFDTLSHETLPSPVPSLLRSTRNCRPALSLGFGTRQSHSQVMRGLCIVSSAVRIVFLKCHSRTSLDSESFAPCADRPYRAATPPLSKMGSTLIAHCSSVVRSVLAPLASLVIAFKAGDCGEGSYPSFSGGPLNDR